MKMMTMTMTDVDNLNRCDNIARRWWYKPLIEEFIKDAVIQWASTKDEYLEDLTLDDKKLMLDDCYEAMYLNDMSSLPDEWVVLLFKLQGFSVVRKRHRHGILNVHERGMLAAEVRLRGVLWKLSNETEDDAHSQTQEHQVV
jgi:hypothetical protein